MASEWEDTEAEFQDNDEPVCPHCRRTVGDAWELFRRGNDEAECDCPSCGKMMLVVAHYEVTYTTFKPKDASKPAPAEGGG